MVRNDEGAALMTVMMMVAVISAAAVVFLETSSLSVRRVNHDYKLAQADHYAMAGEIVALDKAAELSTQASFLALIGADASARRLTVTLENGQMQGELSEASNCLNLAAVRASNGSAVIFRRLLENVGTSPSAAVGLTAALIDWQDRDNSPQPKGAEDRPYSRLALPYLTANTPLSAVSELVLVRGFTSDLISALKPHVCVREAGVQRAVNINTLTITQAPLLAALIGHDVSVQEATQLLANRPVTGYDYIGDFWQQSALKDRAIPQSTRALIGRDSHSYRLLLDINYYDVRRVMTSIIYVDQGGASRVIWRRIKS